MEFDRGYMLWLMNQPSKKMPRILVKIQVRNTFSALIDTKVPALTWKPKAGAGRILILCLTGVLSEDAADNFVLAVLPENSRFKGRNVFLEHSDCITLGVSEIPLSMLEAFRKRFKTFIYRSHLCNECKGKGRVSADPAHASNGATCRTCDGEGRVRGRAIPTS